MAMLQLFFSSQFIADLIKTDTARSSFEWNGMQSAFVCALLFFDLTKSIANLMSLLKLTGRAKLMKMRT